MTCAVAGNRESGSSPSREGSETAFLGMVALPVTSRPCKHCLREELNGVALVASFSKTEICSACQSSVLPMLRPGLKLRYIS